ncbi:MAG: hypothetical protein Fur0022_48560 [Anaerolineales bacterium]
MGEWGGEGVRGGKEEKWWTFFLKIVRMVKGAPYIPIGAGVLIAPRLVLTCAHVINAALNRANLTQKAPAPETRIPCDFPLPAPMQFIQGRVAQWLPPEVV